MQPFPYLLLSRKQENPRTVCLARHVTITPTTTHPSLSHINYSRVFVQTRPRKTFRHVPLYVVVRLFIVLDSFAAIFSVHTPPCNSLTVILATLV